ncbi:MAG: hypothetical protein V9G19_23630 [Tetrasphaera sp.]
MATPDGSSIDQASYGELGSFQRAALADNAISRAELQQAYVLYFDCLRSSGLRGTITVDLDLHPAVAYSLGDPRDTSPDDHHGPDGIAACESRFSEPLARIYVQQHPDSQQVLARKREISLACVTRLDPQLASTLSPSMSYAQISDVVVANAASPASGCPQDLDVPARDLATLTTP